MKSKQFLQEGLADEVNGVDQDHEVQMARADCYYAAQAAIKLHKILARVSEQQGLEGWVSEKITLAADYLKNVCEYMEHEVNTPQFPVIDPGMIPQPQVSEEEAMDEGVFGDLVNKYQQSKVDKAAAKAKADFLARRAELAKRGQATRTQAGPSQAWDHGGYDTAVKRGTMEEGRFTVNAKTGAKLDPRTGAELPPKAKPVTSKQMWADANAAVAARSAGPDLDTVWRKVEYVVGQIFPDGDPIDYLGPWLKKQGVRDFKIGEILTAAAKKHGYRDVYDYWDSLEQDYGDIHEAVDPEFYAALNENIAHILTEHFGGKAWFKGGAYSYQFDVKNPNKMVASDGSVVSITSWAHAIEKYADKSVWQEAQDTFFDTNWQEFFSADQLNEISRDKLVKYADRAISAHGHAAFAARQHQPEDQKKEFERIRDKRAKGISRAYNDERLGGKLREDNGAVNTDQLLEFLTAAWSQIRQSDMYTPEGKQTIARIYEGLRYDLMQGDFEGFERAWDEYGAKYPDHIDELAELAYEAAGLDPSTATYEDFVAAAGLQKRVLDREMKKRGLGEAKGDTIEAHGIRGMGRKPWRKTFKNVAQMNAWADKYDAEILGTRALEQTKKGVTTEMASMGATGVGSIGTVSMPSVKKVKKRIAEEDRAVVDGSETESDIDKKIEFHKQGQAAAQYKGSMNKMHADKIRELEAKKKALKNGSMKEMNLAPANSTAAASATAATKNAIADKLRKSGNTQLAGKLKGGAGTFNKDELDAIVGAEATATKKPGMA